MFWLKQSTTINVKLGPFVSPTDGVTAKTALSPTVKVSKNGGALAARNSATAIAHDADGYYTVELDATDTGTLGRLRATARDDANHLPVWLDFMVLPAVVYDSLVSGSDYLDVSLVQWKGTAPADLSTNGYVQSMVLRWLTDNAGGTPSALSSGNLPADLKLWLATAPLALSSQQVQAIVTAYASGQAPLQPTVASRTLDVSATGEAGLDFDNIKDATGAHTLTNITVPTVSTLTGHTPQTGDNYALIGAAGAGLTGLGDTRLANLDATVSSRSTLTAALVWDALLTGITTVGSIGKLIKDYLDAAITSRLASGSYTAPLDAAGVRTAVGLATADLDTQLAALPTAAENADAVWDEVAADHVTTGSTGKKLTDAGNAGDPWSTALPGSYATGTAGKLLGSLSLSGIAAAIWAYATRILTSTAAETTAAVTGSAIDIQQGDDWSADITGLGDISARTGLYFTVKASLGDTDAQALVQIEETDGLLRIARGAATDATLGSITVTDEAAGNVTVRIRESQTALLSPSTSTLVYDFKMLTAANPRARRLTASTATITGAVTRAVS